jgi:glycosyltransferase involved in cell wall biosynthesis
VICLYKEASQSGIVEQAKYWGVPIIVSNVGGLPEQIRGRENCFVSHSGTVDELKHLVHKSLSSGNLSLNKDRGQTVNEVLLKSLFGT